MKHYFGLKIIPLIEFTVEPLHFNAENPDAPAEGVVIGFTWEELNGFAQYHGFASWEGQHELAEKIDAILGDQMPWYDEGSLFDSVVDEVGEKWLITLPKGKRITANFIEVL